MLTLYQAFARIGGGRWWGDVVKENTKTVWMIFYPPEHLKKKALLKGITLVPTKPIKRHRQKHKVSRFA